MFVSNNNKIEFDKYVYLSPASSLNPSEIYELAVNCHKILNGAQTREVYNPSTTFGNRQ